MMAVGSPGVTLSPEETRIAVGQDLPDFEPNCMTLEID